MKILKSHNQQMEYCCRMLQSHDWRQIKFFIFDFKSKGFVTYGDNNKGKILGIGKLGTPHFITIDDVLYVDGLNNNLLNIYQLCNKY